MFLQDFSEVINLKCLISQMLVTTSLKCGITTENSLNDTKQYQVLKTVVFKLVYNFRKSNLKKLHY